MLITQPPTRELDHRDGDGYDVTLLWHPDTGCVSVAVIEERTRTWSTEALLDALVAAGIPASPVRDVGEAARHEQTLALGILQQLGGFTTVAQPISFDGDRLLHPSPPPALGAT